MAKNTIDIKTNKFFPQFSKSSKWSDIWEKGVDSSFEMSIYDKTIQNTRPSRYQLDVILYKIIDEHNEEILHKFEISGEERENFIPEPGGFNMEAIYRLCIEYLINNKYIKKPKNSSKIQAQKVTELEDLKKQRQRLVMKINAWKKRNKDTTELETQKSQITKQIKLLK